MTRPAKVEPQPRFNSSEEFRPALVEPQPARHCGSPPHERCLAAGTICGVAPLQHANLQCSCCSNQGAIKQFGWLVGHTGARQSWISVCRLSGTLNSSILICNPPKGSVSQQPLKKAALFRTTRKWKPLESARQFDLPEQSTKSAMPCCRNNLWSGMVPACRSAILSGTLNSSQRPHLQSCRASAAASPRVLCRSNR